MASPAPWRSSSEAVKDLRWRLRQETQKVQIRDEEIEWLKSDVSRYRAEARSLRQEVASLRAKLDEHRATAEKLQHDLEAQSQLLHIRSIELREAQAYVATVDTVSHTEILGVADALDAEIFQFAAEAVDGTEFVKTSSAETSPELEGSLGDGMIEVLKAVAQGRCDTMGVQIALQAVIVWLVSWAVSSWAVDPEKDVALEGISRRVFLGEPQGVAAKWKALTMRHSAHLTTHHEDFQRHLLNMASCTLRSAGGRIGETSHSWDNSLIIRMSEIIRLTMKLRWCICEGATSNNFFVIRPPPGQVFTNEVMEDSNAVRGRESAGSVLCMTGLGLMRLEQLRKTREEIGTISSAVLKRASVVLEDAVEELLIR